ncbi:MAG TPA: YciI family protein [Burkholderiales bacterium]|jgi:hypothetical protein|nr:YciI family protein [Burkholderiales bacterium]
MYFLCRLIPPRPGFAKDMTPAEAKAMHEHVAYWTDLLGTGKAIAFGPVMDPKGPWGVGIVSVSDKEELARLQANDPAIRAQIGLKYDAYEMPQVVYKK